MTFTMPSANNLHDQDPDATPGNLRHLANLTEGVGASIRTIVAKANGNLPLSQDAGQFRNNGTSGTSIAGLGYEFQASQASWNVSVDTKLLLWHNQHNAPNRMQVDTVGNGGWRIRIYSGTGSMPTNYKEYYIGGRDTPAAECVKGQFPFVIDLNDTSEDVENGTFDNTAVTSYSYMMLRNNMAGSNDGWSYMGACYVVDTTKTSSDTPYFSGSGSDWDDAVTALQGSDYTDKYGNWIRAIGDVVFIDMPFKVGNNSSITTFDDGGKTVISPAHNDSSNPSIRVTTQAFRVYLYLRDNSADTAEFSGTYIWQVRSPWDFGQSDDAEVTLSGATFKGMGDFEIGSSISGPAIFDDVGVVDMDPSADLDGSIFQNPYGAHLLEIG